MAGQPVYHLVFLISSPRLELRTLAHYNTLLGNLITINLYSWGNSKGAGRCKEIFVSLVGLHEKQDSPGILFIFT
jgi:hypothetical protein